MTAHKLVPVTPSEEMVRAAYANQPDAINVGFAEAYRAMLAAAPVDDGGQDDAVACAIALLEVAAETGIDARFPDGGETPNAKYCREAVKKLRATALSRSTVLEEAAVFREHVCGTLGEHVDTENWRIIEAIEYLRAQCREPAAAFASDPSAPSEVAERSAACADGCLIAEARGAHTACEGKCAYAADDLVKRLIKEAACYDVVEGQDEFGSFAETRALFLEAAAAIRAAKGE